MIKIKPLQNGKRQIDIDTPYLLFRATVGPEGIINVEASEIREPEPEKKATQKKDKGCNTCGKRKRRKNI